MLKSSSFEKGKNIADNIIRYISNLFKLKKEIKVIKDRIAREIRNLFKHEEIRGIFVLKKYIDYESNRDKKKALSVKKYLNKIRPYLKSIINNLRNLSRGKLN